MNPRRLGPADAGAAVALVATFFEQPAGEDSLRAWLADDDRVMIGVWQDDEPAGILYGYFLARPDGLPDMLLVYSIDVAARFRRQGCARAMLAVALSARRGSVWLLTNESNAAAMALYREAGGTRPNPDDVMFRF